MNNITRSIVSFSCFATILHVFMIFHGFEVLVFSRSFIWVILSNRFGTFTRYMTHSFWCGYVRSFKPTHSLPHLQFFFDFLLQQMKFLLPWHTFLPAICSWPSHDLDKESNFLFLHHSSFEIFLFRESLSRENFGLKFLSFLWF